jgi:hypothetical protein
MHLSLCHARQITTRKLRVELCPGTRCRLSEVDIGALGSLCLLSILSDYWVCLLPLSIETRLSIGRCERDGAKTRAAGKGGDAAEECLSTVGGAEVRRRSLAVVVEGTAGMHGKHCTLCSGSGCAAIL